MLEVGFSGSREGWGSICGYGCGLTRTRDATYAEDGPRAAEGLCGAHVRRVVAVEGKDGELSVSIEGAGDGRSERGMKGPARLGAEGDVRFKRFSASENIPYSTCRALQEEKKGGVMWRSEDR